MQIYLDIIKTIQQICEERKIYIGIMVSLRGRKIQLKMDKSYNEISLKKGDIVRIASSQNSKLSSSQNKLVVNLNDFNKVIKVNDNIVIDDNKSILKVLKLIKTNHSFSRTNLQYPGPKTKLLAPSKFKLKPTKVTINSLTEHCDTVSSDDQGDSDNIRMSPDRKMTVQYHKTQDEDMCCGRSLSINIMHRNSLQLKPINKKNDYKDIIHDADPENERDFFKLEKKNNKSIQKIIKETSEAPKSQLSPLLKNNISMNIPNLLEDKVECIDEFESICKVEYPCTISENSCLFVPSTPNFFI